MIEALQLPNEETFPVSLKNRYLPTVYYTQNNIFVACGHLRYISCSK